MDYLGRKTQKPYLSTQLEAMLLALCAAGLSGGCDRRAPPDVSPSAATDAAQEAAAISLRKPTDIVIAYKDQVDRFPRGTVARYAVIVTNNSSTPLLPSGAHKAYITYRWLTHEGRVHSWENPHNPIPSTILPGQSVVAGFDVVSPKQPGKYVLKVIMGVQGGPDLERGGQTPLHYGVVVE